MDTPPPIEEQPAQAANPKPQAHKFEMPAWGRPVIFFGAGLLLAGLVGWSSLISAEGKKRESIARSVDALAETMPEYFIQRSFTKIERMVTKVVDSAGYETVSVTDPQGKVIASSNRAMSGKDIGELKNSITKARLGTDGDVYVIRRSIFLAGDTKLGGVEVRIKRN